MPDIWPLDAKMRLSRAARDSLRPFNCLLLMPFESRFDQVAQVIKETVFNTVQIFVQQFNFELAEIERLDWVNSTGVIQEEIWGKIYEADLIFCDITGYNPNVMFELGVCSGWKKINQIVLIKDHFYKQQSAFDIAPIRYTEYQLTSEGIEKFRNMVRDHTFNVLVGYPDFQGSSPKLTFPLKIEFSGNHDDDRIYTPPYSHRRVVNETLEFGSRTHFAYSWASIGKQKFQNFLLEFTARFSNPIKDSGYIGVGFRSQHYYANFAYILYLNHEGKIIIALPDEEVEIHYKDHILRDTTPIDLNEFHDFRVNLNQEILEIQIDDFHQTFPVNEMKKVLGPGLIRFQSHMSWMGLKEVRLSNVEP